jgi:methylated-DNA-protein-cysteine methyltransferase-like protein
LPAIAIKVYYMAGSQHKFDKAIWKTVSGIASGRVMSYGEVARAAGYPRHARMVSKAMSRSAEALPWYRVVRSDRTLAFAVGSASYNKQQSLLEKEGVRIIKGKVAPVDAADAKDLDEILWGPPD